MNKTLMKKLAKEENLAMMTGKKIPGTPYSTLDHSIIHIKFIEDLKTELRAKKISRKKFDVIFEIVRKHTMQEIKAQVGL